MSVEPRDVLDGYVPRVETQDVYGEPTLDPVYQSKARILNEALQDIGMGKYQWFLFVVTGFGWFSENLSPVVTSLILFPIAQELQTNVLFLNVAQNIGLLIGAASWGVTSDVWGRRWVFNLTLLITGVFTISSGASPNFVALCFLTAVRSIGVGGNMVVDPAVFLEFVPASHQYWLSMFSIWWAFGQLLGTLVAWPFITSSISCLELLSESSCSGLSFNQGWRHLLYTMGGLMMFLWIIQFFVFNLYESPEYLMGHGRDEAAVEVIHKIAAYNGKRSYLTVQHLKDAEKDGRDSAVEGARTYVSATAAVRERLAIFDRSHVKSLFATRKLAYSTSLLIILWALIGLAFPLYNGPIIYGLLASDLGNSFYVDISSSDTTVINIDLPNFKSLMYVIFRSQIILSAAGIPGALAAGYCVKSRFLGRRGTLSIFTLLSGVFVLSSTTVGTLNAFLGFNCVYSFTSNVMYGVLYAVSPELFPTKDRGTGNAIVATTNRVFGVAASVIVLYAKLDATGEFIIIGDSDISISTGVNILGWLEPTRVAGTIFILAGLVALCLPFDPRGRASL